MSSEIKAKTKTESLLVNLAVLLVGVVKKNINIIFVFNKKFTEVKINYNKYRRWEQKKER